MKEPHTRSGSSLGLRVGRVLIGAVLLSGIGFVAPSTPANAACSNFGCNGTNPQTQGCAAGAKNAGSKRFRVFGYDAGIVEARYSDTCKSQWTRLRVEDIGLASVPMTLSYIGTYGNGYNYTGAVSGSSPIDTYDPATWWTAQVGAANSQYYHGGTVKSGAGYYGATIGPV